jgi:hypothetical protein
MRVKSGWQTPGVATPLHPGTRRGRTSREPLNFGVRRKRRDGRGTDAREPPERIAWDNGTFDNGRTFPYRVEESTQEGLLNGVFP